MLDDEFTGHAPSIAGSLPVARSSLDSMQVCPELSRWQLSNLHRSSRWQSPRLDGLRLRELCRFACEFGPACQSWGTAYTQLRRQLSQSYLQKIPRGEWCASIFVLAGKQFSLMSLAVPVTAADINQAVEAGRTLSQGYLTVTRHKNSILMALSVLL